MAPICIYYRMKTALSESTFYFSWVRLSGKGPEHCYLHDIGRAQFDSITDAEALEALQLLSRTEGILPALESSHAIAYTAKLAKTMSKDQIIVVCLSGRGDKDVHTVRRH